MSKERLEEIEKNLDPLGYGMGGHLISVNDIYWLVRYAKEQSERVQELETTVDFYQSALRDADRRVQELEEEVKRYQSGRNVAVITKMKMDELEQQNKRYREALSIISANLPLDEREHYVDIARQALEGET